MYVNNLQANYFQYLGNDFYGQVYGGYWKPCTAARGRKCSIARWQ
ncbi:hypothetical protein ACLK1Y_22615 [Escherichia coli]